MNHISAAEYREKAAKPEQWTPWGKQDLPDSAMVKPVALTGELMLANYKQLVTRDCKQCGEPFETLWTRQQFCTPCGEERRRVQIGRGLRSRKQSKSAALREIEAAAKERSPVIRVSEQPCFEWVVSFKVKYSLDASKNRRWSNNGKGTVYLTESVRRYQDYLIHATKRALNGRQVRQNKVWVGLFVQKPNHKSDAINVVDTICDAIKVAVDVDDRWFCITRLDWEICRTDPEIFISIAQEECEDVIVCSHCGEIKQLEEFGNRKNGPLGKQRVCRDCTRIHGKHQKIARAKIIAEEGA